MPCQGQIKIYPIDELALGPQQARHPIYARLPNFHPIARTAIPTEAFITGRLGDGDLDLLRAVLDAAKHYGAMAELEEYVGEWVLDDRGVTSESEYALLPPVPLDALALAPNIPSWELHHGFDVPKRADEGPPIALAELVAACAGAGLDNGGWFLFANDRSWAYRTNEFQDGSLESARALLDEQARTLRALLAERGIRVPVGYSLERVHGIWTF